MRTRISLIGAVLLTAALTACGGGGESSQASKPAEAAAQAAKPAVGTTVKVTQSSLGQILTDQAGRTLYGFTKDKDGASNCGDACIATWPALTSRSDVAAGEGTDKALLGKTERTEGTTQAKYGEWPLYYYAGDAEAGDVNGQGVDGAWFVVAPDGKLIKTNP